MERDYNHYDYLNVSVKNAHRERILQCYKSLGWRVVKREKDRQFSDMISLVLARPHKMENKDRLQYLQVRMESQINSLSRTDLRRHAASDSLGITFIVFALLLLASGIFLILGRVFAFSLLFGIVFCVLGAGLLAACVYPFYIKRKKENIIAEEKITKGNALLEKFVAEAQRLLPPAESENPLGGRSGNQRQSRGEAAAAEDGGEE